MRKENEMKSVKKIVGIILTLAMVLGMAVTALAAGTGTITITNPTAGNTYKVYKVFDADGNGTNISYKLVAGKTEAPAGFTVDKAGNVTYSGKGVGGQLTADDIAAIAEYVTEDDLVDTVKFAEDATTTSVTTKALDNGYYYITTTTGAAVTITSTNPNVTVEDKNEAPELDKRITGVNDGSVADKGKTALAQVGTNVTYTATIDVKKGAKNYVFHDKMDQVLSYNNDVTVTVDGATIAASDATYSNELATGDTITLTFNNDWIKDKVDKTITITYSAKVTSDALTTNPAENTASIGYGDNNIITDTPTKVYNAKITITKEDDKKEALAGAGFVIAKKDNNQTKYYKLDKGAVSWVTDIAEATELTTTDAKNGNVVTFTGLANGTYTLIEKTVPAGYNKAVDKDFVIKSGDYSGTNLEQSATVVNEAGAVLPSTGGIGTTIFYVVGAILVLGAAVLLVVRRRMNRG